MSVLKMLLSAWLMPLPISLIVVCSGLLFRLGGRRRLGRTLIAAGAIFALGAATGPVADCLLRPLESRYQAVLDASVLKSAPRYVAVLGSGYRARNGLPVTAALDSDGVVRLTEGVRLFRQLPGSLLILSGGSQRGEAPIARGYELAAAGLGVPAAATILMDTPVDTAAEIRAIRARVGDSPVLLVTSAAHMPRAMMYCQRSGLHAIAAPTGNLSDPDGRETGWLPLPSGTSLRKTETAFHEYLGLLALWLGVT